MCSVVIIGNGGAKIWQFTLLVRLLDISENKTILYQFKRTIKAKCKGKKVLYEIEVHPIDKATSFLNDELNEVIFIEQPEGFVRKGTENMVCKLDKAIDKQRTGKNKVRSGSVY